MSGFEKLGLSQVLLDRLSKIIGLKTPTDVQKMCIPKILEGRNVLARAPTGSGKTLAFALPMIQKWSVDPYGIYGLVLTPTRELAVQIKEQLELIGGPTVRVLNVIGGLCMLEQATELQKRPHFVVATPGRLADHLESGGHDVQKLFKTIKFIIYDEADRILDGQFDEQLSELNNCVPASKQTLLFSATMTDGLKKVLSSFLHPFIYDYLENEEKEDEDVKHLIDNSKIVQNYILCSPDFKDGYLIELLRKIRDKELMEHVRSMIIFTSTCRDCQVLSLLLEELGFENAVLHSQMDQKGRTDSLVKFKSCYVPILIATDVASRGLDIKSVDLVINYCVPWPSDYVHRVGRAGRGTTKGNCVMIMVPRDIPFLKKVEDYIGERLVELKLEERPVLNILTEVNTARKMAELKVTENNPFEERKEINKRKKLILEEMTDEQTNLTHTPKSRKRKRKL